MGAQMLFFGAAQPVLEPGQLQALVDRMKAMGAKLELDRPAGADEGTGA